MNVSPLEPPFLWPDFRRLAACHGPTPDFDTLLAESQLVLGVVHGLSAVGVSRLAKILTKESATNQNGNKEKTLEEIFDDVLEELFGKKVRLIVTLYPACPTTSAVLRALFQLQVNHAALEVRLVTCDIGSAPENTLACYKAPDSTPIVLFGSSASLEDVSDDPTRLTLAFSPEPILADAWQKWFDVKWLKAAPLTDARTNIPRLVLPEGTDEAARQWAAYEQSCREEQEDEAHIKVTVDPGSGEITATSSGGSPVKTISAENQLPQVSPVYRKLAHLLDQGHLVSVDKSTRLLPFEVSVKPKWFGVETLKQIGSVRQQVSYHISALTEDELKQLENRRKKTSELLELFSFSLADGQRWMPKAAEELFRQERKRINKEAKGVLSELIAGDLDNFIAGRRNAISEDANRMYRDLFPDQSLSEVALNEITAALKKRFEEAQNKSFLPQLSFNRVSLPQTQSSAWKSQFGSALRLLLSIARYPRKACCNGAFFARGLTARPPDILKAMNLLDDPFIEVFDHFGAKERAESELEKIEEIEASNLTAEEKCQQLFELLGHQIVATKEVKIPDPLKKAAKELLAIFDLEEE